MRPLYETVPAQRVEPLVPHDRSSVRRCARVLLLFFCLTAALPVAAQRPVGAVVPAPVAPSISANSPIDSLFREPIWQGLRLFTDSLLPRRRTIFELFATGAAYHPDPTRVAQQAVLDAQRRKEQLLRRRWTLSVQRDLLQRTQATTVAATAVDSGPTPGALVPLLKSRRRDGADARTQLGGDIFGSNLGINLTARLESKLQRTRNQSCTAAQLANFGTGCAASLQPAFDFQFNVKTGGVIADRVNLNVDYDSQREFDASNNISIFYQGKSDELLQRLEVGNVTFQPPPSRFLTAGIPAGNYGVQARGQIGPMRFTGIVAQQKGNVSKDNVFTIGDRSQQLVERPIEDIQIETRRFFFTIDPRQLRGYPNIDMLNRQQMQQLASSLPDSVRPTRIFIYRQRVGATNQNPRGPQFSVRGARNPTRQTYELLRENVDYYVDPSQLWISLVRPVDANSERLAVAYEVTQNGVPGRNINTGGSPDIELTDAPQFANLLWEPELQPTNLEYFFREIKSVYRLGGEDVQRGTITLKVVTGTSGDQEKPFDPSRGETYLQLFGLSQATNPSAFDVENRVWPRPNDPNFSVASGGQKKLIPDFFVMFPSLQPFARAGLAQPLANPANDTLYRYPNEYLYSAQRPQAIYRLLAKYQSEGGGATQSIRLNSIQLRPNSERVALEGQLLVRDTDYKIDYDLGTITFSRPDTLFPRARQVTVRYEENPQFAAAPTTIVGFASQFPLDNGQLSFTAISQQQNSSLTRPPLGFEPSGSLVAGMTANLAWDAPLLTRALGKLPFGGGNTRSRVQLQGEFAMSKPQPNSAGQAYIESFEGDAGVPISLAEGAWYFSSRPSLGSRLPSVIGSNTLALNRATTLAYQNNGFDGNNFLQFSIQQIDPLVRTTGAGVQQNEQLLWLGLHPLKAGGIYDYQPDTNVRRFAWTIGDNSMVGNTPSGRRWRSLRYVLNPNGSDLSRVENIEFFVLLKSEASKVKRNPTLVFDFGEISENSVAFAPETLTINRSPKSGRPDSTYRGKRLVGYDRFDSERDPFSRTFNAIENDKGLPGDVADTIVIVDRTVSPATITTANKVTLCAASVQDTRQLGDSRGNCTVRNSRLDEEDIDLDGQLNLPSSAIDQEQFKRFSVDLADVSKWTRVGKCYQSAASTTTGVAGDSLCWVQIKLNWRAPLEEQNAPNERRMRALRMTMVSSAGVEDDAFQQIALARFKLVSAPWLKRAGRPISGAAGDSLGPINGYVIAGVIGTLDSSATLPYSAPPGVIEVAETKSAGYTNAVVQVNERALRLQAGIPGQQFRTFDRAEAYYRFPEGTKSFMGYRSLRVWMRGRGNGWGVNGELNGFIKIGRDEHNFYMYRTPVGYGPSQSAWDPEVRVDLTRFQALRAQLENNFLTASKDSISCSGTDLELIKRSGLPTGLIVRRYAVCQDGYIVYSADPSVTPPNLAGVQELSVGFVRVDSIPRGANAIMANDSLELWIDDIRLTDVVDDIGFAGELGVSFNAADLAEFRMNVNRRDPNFRQLGETPSFLTTSGVSIGSTFHLERMLPARLGIVLPFNVDYAGAGVEQLFINRTDVRATGITGLRNPKDSRVGYSLALRRATPLSQGWYAPVLNGLSLNGAWSSGATRSAFQEASNANYVLGGSLDISDDTREGRLPGFFDRLFDALPKRLRDTDAIRGFRAQRFRWRPTQLRLTSAMARNANAFTSFTKAAASPTDTGQTVNGLTHVWRNTGELRFAPTAGTSASVVAQQTLDLRDYRDATSLPDSADRRQAAAAERLKFLGAPIGLERDRSLTSAIGFQPSVSIWFRPRFEFTSRFDLNKDPNARSLLREGDSTGAFRLPKRLGAFQTFRTGTTLDLGRLLSARTAEKSVWHSFGRWLAPLDVNWSQSLTSNYDNTALLPSFGYQLGLGGLSDFRGLNSNLATSAGRVRQLNATGSLNLPYSLSIRTRLDNNTSETWTRRSLDGFQALITSDQRTYPDITASWNWRPVRLAKVFTALTLTGRLTQSIQQTVIPNDAGGTADRSRAVSRSQPISGSITWAFLGGLTTNGSLDHSWREEIRPGSITTGESKRMSIDVARQFKLPKQWNTRGNLRTQATYVSDQTISIVGGATSTTTIDGTTSALVGTSSVLTDNGRRAFNFNANTDLSELVTFSLTGSQVLTFDRNYNRRIANTAISVVMSLRFFAGELR